MESAHSLVWKMPSKYYLILKKTYKNVGNPAFQINKSWCDEAGVPFEQSASLLE